MKLLVLAALVGLTPLTAPVTALAQVAAGSVPNTFDRAAPSAAAAAPAPAPAAIPPVTDPANPRAEEVLRTIISGAQTGAIDYSLMTDDLAAKVREQEGQLAPIIRSFGSVQAVDFVGSQDGADLFVVTFANAATQWVIGFQDDKVAALLFRPAQ